MIHFFENQSKTVFAVHTQGDSAYLIPLDILGISRTLPPDLGAYQNKPFPK
jgi:hypothetical protein